MGGESRATGDLLEEVDAELLLEDVQVELDFGEAVLLVGAHLLLLAVRGVEAADFVLVEALVLDGARLGGLCLAVRVHVEERVEHVDLFRQVVLRTADEEGELISESLAEGKRGSSMLRNEWGV